MSRVTAKTKIIFIDDPCNPVGSRLDKSEQEYILNFYFLEPFPRYMDYLA